MSLGKRPRQPMKRTTSMTEITFDLAIDDEDPPPSDGARAPSSMSGTNKLVTGPGLGGAGHYGLGLQLQQNGYGAGGGADPWDQRLLAATVSPRLAHRRQSCDVVETSHFLRSCSLCKRRLVPGRDIYMYRGDSAFCSLECRQQQMTQDERKDNKCSMVTSKKEASSAAAAAAAKGKTTVAAAAAV